MADNKVRVDKWLWAVRIYKTRSQATDACKAGKVKIDDKSVKPAHIVQVGDTIKARRDMLQKVLVVKQLLEKRVASAIAVEAYEDLTPEEDILRLKSVFISPFGTRERGTGRPTKKERRDIDEWKEEED